MFRKCRTCPTVPANGGRVRPSPQWAFWPMMNDRIRLTVSHVRSTQATSHLLIGAITNTNSKGRFDLLVFSDGMMAIRGSYVGVVLRAGGAGSGAAPAAGMGWGAGGAYDDSRISRAMAVPREELLRQDSRNFFLELTKMTSVVLERHWYGHGLTVFSTTNPSGRRFTWKPALNQFHYVRDIVTQAFGPIASLK